MPAITDNLITSIVSGVSPNLKPVNPDLEEEGKEDEEDADEKVHGKKKKPQKTPPNYHQDYVAELERPDDNPDVLF